MAVTAPSNDPAGAQIDAQIVVLQALVNKHKFRPYEARLIQDLNSWQVLAVDHYMVTGWLSAVTILAVFQPPAWDKVGQRIATRVAFLQALYDNAPVMPPGNANGYGGSGWTTIKAARAQELYAKQIELVEHIMDLPGGTPADTILSYLSGGGGVTTTVMTDDALVFELTDDAGTVLLGLS